MLPRKEFGYRYPQWQFSAEPERIAAVLQPFIRTEASCWVIHSFLRSPHVALDGVSPRERILDPPIRLSLWFGLRPKVTGAIKGLANKQIPGIRISWLTCRCAAQRWHIDFASCERLRAALGIAGRSVVAVSRLQVTFDSDIAS